MFSREYYVDLVERKYFGNVEAQDIKAACSCFTNDAKVIIYHGDNEVRRYYGTPGKGEAGLEVFYDHLLGNYDAEFNDFEHTVDLDSERCASNFVVTLTPKIGSDYEESGILTLNNSNFFRCKEGKIFYMVIYYANPTLGAKIGVNANSPTGFPKS
jgi:hypothetical protein